MKKVIVIGCPGSGKSTFSKALHEITGLRLFHLDMLYWKPDKTSVDREYFDSCLQTILHRDEWIIDGNYGRTMDIRMQACDTVFFLDYPTETCLDGIQSRKGKKRSDLPWVESAALEDEEFISFIKNYNTDSRPNVIKLLKKYQSRDIFIFHSRTDADDYLAKLKNCK